jgi:hypothetical protein
VSSRETASVPGLRSRIIVVEESPRVSHPSLYWGRTGLGALPKTDVNFLCLTWPPRSRNLARVVATELGVPYGDLLKAKQVYVDLYPRHLQQGFSHKRQRGGRPNYHSALLMLAPVDGVRAKPTLPRTKPEWHRDRKRSKKAGVEKRPLESSSKSLPIRIFFIAVRRDRCAWRQGVC